MISKVILTPGTKYPDELSDYYILNLASAGLDVAKNIAEVRPDALMVPLTGGLVPYRIAMEALRKNLKVSTMEYDPVVIFVPAGYAPYKNEITNKILENFLEKRRRLEGKRKFNKLMILDTVDTGISLNCILAETRDTLRKLAKKIYVSCIVTPEDFRVEDREKRLSKYQKSFFRSIFSRDEFVEKFFFHPSIAVHEYDNEPSIIGCEKYDFYNDNRKKISFFPPYNPERSDYEPGIWRRFYMRINDALEKFMIKVPQEIQRK
jgi:hypoxanthine phosphoribosyltransferase